MCSIQDFNPEQITVANYSRNGAILRLMMRRIQWTLSRGLIDLIANRVYGEALSLKKRLFFLPIGFMSVQSLYRLWQKICTWYEGRQLEMMDAVSIPSYCSSEVNYFSRGDVAETVEVPFEDTVTRIPAGYDHCLRHTYGDYMELPPAAQRGTHHNAEVFYDPYRPYTYYFDTKAIEDFFSGDKAEKR